MTGEDRSFPTPCPHGATRRWCDKCQEHRDA